MQNILVLYALSLYLITCRRAKGKASSEASSNPERDGTQGCPGLSLTQSRAFDILLES